jgi:two-component system, cell cycle response regulator
MTDSKETGAQGSIKKAKILLVDDSKVVRLTATKILSAQFDLVLAEDGEEAWKKICEDDGIQVVFTDIGMPKLDGYGLIQKIRQSENEGVRNQPIIVITGAAEEEEVRRKVFELGATDFITKPFRSTEIIARAEAHASYSRDKDSLQKSVDIDLLTGALNRGGLSKQLKKDVSFVNRHGENMAVILFELDDFKTIYKRIGRDAADRIIKQTATALLGAIRSEDSVGRYGLEKFVIILPMAKTEGVVILAKRLCEKIKSFKMSIGGQALQVTMSAGISIVRKGITATEKNLLESAEEALSNAKAVGSGEVQILKLEERQGDETTLVVSVDSVLDMITKGKTDMAKDQMDAVLKRLAPLVALMTDKQKHRLLRAHE